MKFFYLKIVGACLFSLYFFNCISTPDNYHFISGVNLIIHEAGHFIFIFFGEFIHILGGSLTQVLIPLIFAGYFFLRKDNFSLGIILMWVGESIVEVARYAADAQVMQLPLLGGDNVIHDWNYLFSETGLLRYTSTISSIMHNTGFLIFVAGIIISFTAIILSRKSTNNYGDVNQ